MTRLHYTNNRQWDAGHLLILLVLTCLCFWPLTFGIFSAKNDNIQQFLPIRFHVSEALRNGNLPLWSPYIYTGYPIHGDIQGGAWNPVVWMLSVFGRYDVTILHFEILICIFIAGCGMYRLLGIHDMSKNLKLAGAAAYIMCGFVTDVAGSNLPFLWAAAYTPFVFAYYYELLQRPSLKNAVKPAIALCLLLSSAYPSFFIITAYILAAAFIVVIARKLLQKNKQALKPIVFYNGLMAVFFTGLGCLVILSYLHVIPFYERGNGVELVKIFANSFHPSCSTSFILPSVAFKNPDSFVTDLISRNAYFNILVLMFLLSYIWMKKTALLNFIFAGVLFFFLFSLGDHTPIRALCYHLLPLMDTFRHPSNARLFLIIGSIVAGMWIINAIIHQALPKYLKISSYIFLAGLMTAMGLALTDLHIFSLIHELAASGPDMRIALKNFLDSLTLHDVLFINGLIQAITILAFLLLWNKKNLHKNRLATLLIANSFLIAQLTIPYTLVSKVSPDAINTLLKNYPKGYPDPGNQSIQFNSTDVLENFDIIGINGFYNKKISLTDVVFTPTFMKPIERVLADSTLRNLVYTNSYAFFAGEISENRLRQATNGILTRDSDLLSIKQPSQGSLELLRLSNNRFEFKLISEGHSVFCLQQLFLPGWQAEMDGKPVNLYHVNEAYMALKVPAGEHIVRMYYQPNSIIIGCIVSLLSIIAVLFIFLKPTSRR